MKIKASKAFKRWLSLAKMPQGNYQMWQYLEFEMLAWRAWQAALKSTVKKEVK